MLAVADTTPLNYLVLVGQINILPKLFTQLLVPEAVIAELRHPAAPAAVRDWAVNLPASWLVIRKPMVLDATLEFLGAGEREAIALAEEMNADALLLDERAGRRAASNRGLRVIGTLAVLDEAGQRDLLNFDAVLKTLRQTSFRVSPALLKTLGRF